MALTVLTLATAVVIRLVALNIILRKSYYPVQMPTIVFLAILSTFFGFIMPAPLLDVSGFLFRAGLFVLAVMLLARTSMGEAVGVVVIASIIESTIIVVLSLSPLSYLVAGMNWASIP
jgi:hypothetical protein